MTDRTFFPAYLPRVMMATRPTLRTRQIHQLPLFSLPSVIFQLTLHSCGRRSAVDGLVVDCFFELVKNSLWKGFAALPVEIARLVSLASRAFPVSNN